MESWNWMGVESWRWRVVESRSWMVDDSQKQIGIECQIRMGVESWGLMGLKSWSNFSASIVIRSLQNSSPIPEEHPCQGTWVNGKKKVGKYSMWPLVHNSKICFAAANKKVLSSC